MYSTQRATSDGTLILLDISIDYLDRESIMVLFDSVQQAVGTTWDWVGTTDKRISFTPAVPAGVNVDVVRTSDLSEVRHLFAGGAAFLPETMDENFNHILQIAQEARERATLQDVFQNIDMHGFQLVNLIPGTATGHSVEYSQLVAHDAVIVGYRNTTQGYRDQAQAYRNQAEIFAQAASDSAADSAGAAADAVAAHIAVPDPHPQYVLETEIGSTVQAYDADTAKLDVAQAWAAVQTAKDGTLPDAASIVWDGDANGQVVACTLTAARTFAAPTNIRKSAQYILRLTTGGFTPLWNLAYKWPADGAPSSLESGTYIFHFLGGAGNTLEPTGPGYLNGA